MCKHQTAILYHYPETRLPNLPTLDATAKKLAWWLGTGEDKKLSYFKLTFQPLPTEPFLDQSATSSVEPPLQNLEVASEPMEDDSDGEEGSAVEVERLKHELLSVLGDSIDKFKSERGMKKTLLRWIRHAKISSFNGGKFGAYAWHCGGVVAGKRGMKGRIPVNQKAVNRRKATTYKGKGTARQGRPATVNRKRNEHHLAKSVQLNRKNGYRHDRQ